MRSSKSSSRGASSTPASSATTACSRFRRSSSSSGNQSVGDADLPEGAPRFFTYKAKWDPAYRKKWGIRAGPPKDLDAATEQRIAETARKAYHALGVTGYARVDVRVMPSGEIWVIEVNPNPGLASSDEFAKAAARADLPYETLIDRIVQLAATRRRGP